MKVSWLESQGAAANAQVIGSSLTEPIYLEVKSEKSCNRHPDIMISWTTRSANPGIKKEYQAIIRTKSHHYEKL